MTVFRSKWDDLEPETLFLEGAESDKSPSGTSGTPKKQHFRSGEIDNEVCGQCGVVLGDGELLDTVTGGEACKIHLQCYEKWFDCHIRTNS